MFTTAYCCKNELQTTRIPRQTTLPIYIKTTDIWQRESILWKWPYAMTPLILKSESWSAICFILIMLLLWEMTEQTTTSFIVNCELVRDRNTANETLFEPFANWDN